MHPLPLSTSSRRLWPFVSCASAVTTSFQQRTCGVLSITVFLHSLRNTQVDRVVRRADIFVAGGGSRVPQGLVKAEEESCDGFDVARNKSSVLPSRQTNTRKLSRYRASSGASRVASPLDAKPVQEERTPARSAALFQARTAAMLTTLYIALSTSLSSHRQYQRAVHAGLSSVKQFT